MLQRRDPLLARLLLVVPVLVVLVLSTPRAPYPSGDLAFAQSLAPDLCAGDEVITVAPSAPLADEDLLIAVTSSRQHRGVWLAGSERAVFLRDYEGQNGWVWNWLVVPRYAGPLRLQFFIDSTTFCTEASILVGPSAQRQPAAL